MRLYKRSKEPLNKSTPKAKPAAGKDGTAAAKVKTSVNCTLATRVSTTVVQEKQQIRVVEIRIAGPHSSSKFSPTKRAKFNSIIRAANIPCREFILQLNKQASKCNYVDRVEEQLCDRLIAGINDISLQLKMLEKKDITFTEARKVREQIDDFYAATNADKPALFHRQST
ncbi:unnamed protein product [Echinostoma caproni]|uniref:BAG domain-containing protein n=1 Tax=Echinostoma caproni TaxID=27848 RepID=A0A183ATC3_9TREM|nr:unnamed protein product [Echinostoma caproni]